MKATKETIRKRVEEVHAIRLDGAQFVDIRQYAAEKCAAGEPPWATEKDSPPLSDRTLWRYVQASDRLIAESCREGHRRRLRRHLAQRRNLYAKAVSQGDTRAALACLRDEAELLGLYEFEFARQLEDLRRQLEEVKRNGTGDPQAPGGEPGDRTGPARARGAPGPDPAAG